MPKRQSYPNESDPFSLIVHEHRGQSNLFVEVRGAMSGGDWMRAGRILEALLESTKVHTTSENLLMWLYRYPDEEHHQAEHREMERRIEEARDALLGDDKAAALAKLDAFGDWLKEHLANEDAALEQYLRRRRSE